MFIVYTYIRFNQDLDENSYVSAKIEEVKPLIRIFSDKCGTAPRYNQIVDSHGLF